MICVRDVSAHFKGPIVHRVVGKIQRICSQGKTHSYVWLSVKPTQKHARAGLPSPEVCDCKSLCKQWDIIHKNLFVRQSIDQSFKMCFGLENSLKIWVWAFIVFLYTFALTRMLFLFFSFFCCSKTPLNLKAKLLLHLGFVFSFFSSRRCFEMGTYSRKIYFVRKLVFRFSSLKYRNWHSIDTVVQMWSKALHFKTCRAIPEVLK